jgi:hypothetical protein
MKSIKSKIVMFITGAFVSHSCWDEWRAYFESKGYKTIVQPSPHKDAAAAELRRRHPDPAIASVRLRQLVEHFQEIQRQRFGHGVQSVRRAQSFCVGVAYVERKCGLHFELDRRALMKSIEFGE